MTYIIDEYGFDLLLVYKLNKKQNETNTISLFFFVLQFQNRTIFYVYVIYVHVWMEKFSLFYGVELEFFTLIIIFVVQILLTYTF